MQCTLLLIVWENVFVTFNRIVSLYYFQGLEIYSDEESSIPHMYLTFQCEYDRDRIYSMLESSPNVKLESVYAEEMTLQWQNGIVSNYDYLMYLNW